MKLEVRLRKEDSQVEYLKDIVISELVKINGQVLTVQEIRKERYFLSMSALDGYADGKVMYAGNGDRILRVTVREERKQSKKVRKL